MINVVIPILRCDMLIELLFQIENNTVLPKNVLIINNSAQFITMPKLSFEIRQITFDKNIGVNASWNYGIEYFRGQGHLSILNDDIFIRKNFFERIEKAFESDCKMGVVCPHTVNDIHDFLTYEIEEKISPMRRREGWAFTFRKEFSAIIDSIPKELHTFYGDDWFWIKARDYSFYWGKDFSNVVYHRIGSSMRLVPEHRARLKSELRAFLRIVNNRHVKSSNATLRRDQ